MPIEERRIYPSAIPSDVATFSPWSTEVDGRQKASLASTPPLSVVLLGGTGYVSLCVCVCVSLCLCVSLCISLCAYMYISICVYMYLCVYLYVCMCLYLSLCTLVSLCVCVSVYVCVSVPPCMCLHMSLCVYVCVCMCNAAEERKVTGLFHGSDTWVQSTDLSKVTGQRGIQWNPRALPANQVLPTRPLD